MVKSVVLVLICMASLLLLQCKNKAAAVQEEAQQTNGIAHDMEMRNPAFAKAKTTFNTWLAGVQGGGSGINMQFAWDAMPENLVMKEAYFRGLHARIQQGQKGYTANFKYVQNGPKDIVMHSDPLQEAVNAPPLPKKKRFPVELLDTQVGIIYEENGELVYTIMNNPIEMPQVAYPSAPPRGEGY
jgi:hypothetical protein